MKKYFLTLFAISALALTPIAHAQFGSMPSIGGLLGDKKTSATANLDAQQGKLVRSYVAAGNDILTANGNLAEALGIKAQSVNAAATSDSISAKDIEEQDKAISADAIAVSTALKSGAKLMDNESKAKYAKGLVFLASGLKKYIDMRQDAQGFASGMSSASPLEVVKLQSAAYIVKSLPTTVTNLTSVFSSAVEFAKSNGVEIPKDATSLL
jgi:hypothetical protein